ncbi:MAG: bifunctional chorismate mutase/prephenate dehydrogenase [Phycisphaerales bacterium]|jgi:chorismate mutase/prephenate dehydrogenase|nr:bifunctional chorismate mutase/prephenate dehydrogenase [Phycisphaerales bacterium]
MEHPSKSNLPPKELLPLREKIDAIDHQIIQLLKQRNEVVTEVAAIKKSTGFAIRDFIRERDLLEDRGQQARESELRAEVIESLFRVILWASRDKQASLGAELPEETQSKKIAIIGGNGGMGRVMANLFKDAGNEVVIADLDTPMSNAEAAANVDVTIIAVPIAETIDVIKEVAPHCKEGSLLMDVTSTKCGPVNAMCEHSNHTSVIGTHPLFGPSVHSLQGQRIAVVCGRDTYGWKGWLETLLHSRGFSVLNTTATEHDEAMSIVQVLTHQATEVLGRTIQKLGVDVQKTLAFTSPIYLIDLLMAARHFAQSADLYASIQMNNPETANILNTLKESGEELREIVMSNDRERFRKLFSEVHEHFGQFSEQALEQSSFLIDRLVERG